MPVPQYAGSTANRSRDGLFETNAVLNAGTKTHASAAPNGNESRGSDSKSFIAGESGGMPSSQSAAHLSQIHQQATYAAHSTALSKIIDRSMGLIDVFSRLEDMLLLI